MVNPKDYINQLRQWMQAYDDNGVGGAGPDFANRMGSMFSPGSPPRDLGPARSAWAERMMQQTQNQENMAMPDFFGSGQSGQGGGQRSEYVQPSYAQQENPYTARAMQLNNDPYSGRGGQNDIQNYLRGMMGITNRGGGNRMGG